MNNLKITLVSGSHRKDSESLKVSEYFSNLIKNIDSSIDCQILNLAKTDIPFWDEDQSENSADTRWKTVWPNISKLLNDSHAFVIVSPEWHGMVPSKLKNLFLLCSKGELNHKPALLISVSGGVGGQYPIAELRMSSYKNCKICYLPEQIIIRFVKNFTDNKQSPEITELKERLLTGAKMLTIYAENFKDIRSKIKDGNLNKFTNGM